MNSIKLYGIYLNWDFLFTAGTGMIKINHPAASAKLAPQFKRG
jgi:hypothetical protein